MLYAQSASAQLCSMRGDAPTRPAGVEHQPGAFHVVPKTSLEVGWIFDHGPIRSPAVDITVEIGMVYGFGVDENQLVEALPNEGIGPNAIEIGQRLQHVQVGVVSFGADGADIHGLARIGNETPIFVEEFLIAAVLFVVGLLFQNMKQVASRGQSFGIAGGAMVGDQAIHCESIQVNMLAGVNGFARVADLGVVAAMYGVTHVSEKKIVPGLGRREGGLFLDALPGQRAKEPELPALEREEFFARWRELAVAEQLEVAAVGRIDASGHIEIDDAGFEKLPAPGRLLYEFRV